MKKNIFVLIFKAQANNTACDDAGGCAAACRLHRESPYLYSHLRSPVYTVYSIGAVNFTPSVLTKIWPCPGDQKIVLNLFHFNCHAVTWRILVASKLVQLYARSLREDFIAAWWYRINNLWHGHDVFRSKWFSDQTKSSSKVPFRILFE